MSKIEGAHRPINLENQNAEKNARIDIELLGLVLTVWQHIIETLTDDEWWLIYEALRGDTICAGEIVDQNDFFGETLRDLFGGVVLGIRPNGMGEGICAVYAAPGNRLVELDTWAYFDERDRDDNYLETRRYDVIAPGMTVSQEQIGRAADAFLKIVRKRARKAMEKQREEATDDVDI